MKPLRIQCLLIGFFLISGCIFTPCAHADSDPVKSVTESQSKLSKDQVLQIARFAVTKHGLRLDSFQSPEAHFELVEKDQSWTVFFTNKTLAVDGDCMVIIDGNTGRYRVVVGH